MMMMIQRCCLWCPQEVIQRCPIMLQQMDSTAATNTAADVAMFRLSAALLTPRTPSTELTNDLTIIRASLGGMPPLVAATARY